MHSFNRRPDKIAGCRFPSSCSVSILTNANILILKNTFPKKQVTLFEYINVSLIIPNKRSVES